MFLPKYAERQKGYMFILFAAVLPIFVSILLLVFDLGYVYCEKLIFERSVEAAATAGFDVLVQHTKRFDDGQIKRKGNDVSGCVDMHELLQAGTIHHNPVDEDKAELYPHDAEPRKNIMETIEEVLENENIMTRHKKVWAPNESISWHTAIAYLRLGYHGMTATDTPDPDKTYDELDFLYDKYKGKMVSHPRGSTGPIFLRLKLEEYRIPIPFFGSLFYDENNSKGIVKKMPNTNNYYVSLSKDLVLTADTKYWHMNNLAAERATGMFTTYSPLQNIDSSGQFTVIVPAKKKDGTYYTEGVDFAFPDPGDDDHFPDGSKKTAPAGLQDLLAFWAVDGASGIQSIIDSKMKTANNLCSRAYGYFINKLDKRALDENGNLKDSYLFKTNINNRVNKYGRYGISADSYKVVEWQHETYGYEYYDNNTWLSIYKNKATWEGTTGAAVEAFLDKSGAFKLQPGGEDSSSSGGGSNPWNAAGKDDAGFEVISKPKKTDLTWKEILSMSWPDLVALQGRTTNIEKSTYGDVQTLQAITSATETRNPNK